MNENLDACLLNSLKSGARPAQFMHYSLHYNCRQAERAGEREGGGEKEMKADFICGSETETSVSSADTKPPSAFLCANETSQVCTVTDVA